MIALLVVAGGVVLIARQRQAAVIAAAPVASPAPQVPRPATGPVANAISDYSFSGALARQIASGNVSGAAQMIASNPGYAASVGIGTAAAGLTGGLSYLIPQLGAIRDFVNDAAKSAAARKGWQAVESGLELYAQRLIAAGVTDNDTRNYLVYTWAADFGIRGRNGAPPWPGRVPVRQSGILASERIRDASLANLRRRHLPIPNAPLVDGSFVPGFESH